MKTSRSILRLASALTVTVTALLLAAPGCRDKPKVQPVSPPVPRLPTSPTAFAPAHTQIEGAVTGEWVSDVELCGGCHADVFAQQQASAHAWSSFNNPAYRYSTIALRNAVGFGASKMCAGCHDTALLVDGAMDAEVSPRDPRAHAGVTCRVCHSMSAASVDGNGSFTLDANKISLPKADDPASIARHKASARPIAGDAMCGSCHRGFLSRATGNSHFLPGMDELTGHTQSAYASGGVGRIDRVEPKTCIGCHMPKVAATLDDPAAKDGKISSHRFTGGHTWLAAMLGDDKQLKAQQAMLRGVVSIDVGAARVDGVWSYPAELAVAKPNAQLEFDVVMRNTSVGHRFPAGVLDAQDVFIVATARDSRGAVIASAGEGHRRGEVDESAHILRALVADQDGQPRFERDVQHFAAVVVNHTIAPRDAAVVRFRLEVPEEVALPLSLEVALIHRSRNGAVVRLACAESKTERGLAFSAFERKEGRTAPDPCVAVPETIIAKKTRVLAGTRPATRDDANRLYELGLGLAHVVSERLEEARAPLLRALEVVGEAPLGGDEGAALRARILTTLAAVTGRQGRTDDALELFARAEKEVGSSPALSKLRGDALAKVWRWKEAEAAYTKAAAGVPGNSTVWRLLAIARGSLGNHTGALEAARTGLKLSPRDADMLRVQALAIEALSTDAALKERSLEAYDVHRPPDRAGDIRIECAKTVPACAIERQPVHTHQMHPR